MCSSCKHKIQCALKNSNVPAHMIYERKHCNRGYRVERLSDDNCIKFKTKYKEIVHMYYEKVDGHWKAKSGMGAMHEHRDFDKLAKEYGIIND